MKKLNFKEPRNIEAGRTNYSSSDLLKLYVYVYSNGISRELEKQAALKSVLGLFADFCDELGLYGKT